MSEKVWIHPQYGPTLRAAGLCSIDDFMRRPGQAVLSKHRNRETVAIHLDDSVSPTFYLKRVFRVRLRHLLTDLVHLRPPRSQPQREWSAIHKLQNCGIGVVGGVALGWVTRLGIIRQAFILLLPVRADKSLAEQFLTGWAGSATGVRWGGCGSPAADLGGFVRKFHEAGLRCSDLACKHVYARPPMRRNDHWQFELVDVERLTVTRSRRAGIRDLRNLLRSLPATAVRRTDLVRFAKAYTDEPVRSAFAWARAEWDRLTRRARSPVNLPDDFADLCTMRFVRSGGIVYNAAFAGLVEEHNLGDFNDWVGLPAERRLDKAGLKSWRIRARLQLKEAGGNPFVGYLKRFIRPPLTEQFMRILFRRPRESTAWYEWTQIKRLTARGIATASPVVYGQWLIGPYEWESFLVTAEIPGESLERWGPENFALEHPSTPERRVFLRQLAHFVAAFHDAGFVHRDLYLSHIFVSMRKDESPAFRLIDLQRVFRPRLRRQRWIVKDLAALNFSAPRRLATRTERLRFLRDYLPGTASRMERQRLARAVLAKTAKMARHNPHLQSPLDPIQHQAGGS